MHEHMYIYVHMDIHIHVYIVAEKSSQFRGLVLANNKNFYGKIKSYGGLLIKELQPPSPLFVAYV